MKISWLLSICYRYFLCLAVHNGIGIMHCFSWTYNRLMDSSASNISKSLILENAKSITYEES